LSPVFRYRHWAGIAYHTHVFTLAVSCVFIKQSERPSHCDQPFARLAPLIPKVRGQFAEFPRLGLDRDALAFSARGTCVSSRYGHLSYIHDWFSRTPAMGRIPLRGDYSRPANVLTITVLPLATPLEQDDGLARLRLMCYNRGKCSEGAGILTGFPFPCVD
jgi:hypothetical protein